MRARQQWDKKIGALDNKETRARKRKGESARRCGFADRGSWDDEVRTRGCRGSKMR